MNLKKNNTVRLKCLLFTAMLPLLCVNLTAQQVKAPIRLSPDEAVELALKNNLTLEASRIGIATKQRASKLSWNQFIPDITVGGALLRDNKKTISEGITPIAPTGMVSMIPLPPGTELPPGADVYLSAPYSIELPQWHIAGTIQASLTINFAMFENMKRLRLDYQSGLLGYEKAKAQLERDVRKAYHNMLLIQENITLLQGGFANAERQVQMAQANYNAGLAPELTLLQARVAMENLRPVIDQAENGLKLSMAQFAMFLGMDYDTSFELIPITEAVDFVSFNIEEMITMAANKKPDIQELRHTILMLESARKMQVYSLTPALTLSWNNNSVFTKNPWKDSWFKSDDWNNSGSLTISLGVRLHSLIPFSTDFQSIKNMDDQIKAASIGLAQMINGTEIEIYNILLALERTQRSKEAQQQTVSLAEQSFNLTEQAYRAGLLDYFQVQSAEQSLQQARVQMLEQQFNYINSLIDLEYATGVPFGTLSSTGSGRSR